MATKNKIVRIVGKLTHPLMSWSDITDQSFENRSSPESPPKVVALEQKSVPSNDSLEAIMKNGKRNSKTSSLNPSSTSLGSINSQIRLYIQRRLGRQRQELSGYKSKNEANANVSEVNTENQLNYSSKPSRKKKTEPAETSLKVEKQRAKPKIKKKLKFQTLISPISSKTAVAKPILKNEIDTMVNSVNKKLQRKPRLKSPAKRNAVAKRNLNLKAQNKVPVIAAKESNDENENIELHIHISESENEVKIKPSNKKATKKKRSERKPHIPRKSKKNKNTNIDVAEHDSKTININSKEDNLEVEEIPSIKTLNEESDYSRPKVLHINPKQMGKSETVIPVVENKNSAEFPLDTIGMDEAVNNVEKKVIIMELKPSEINKRENAWKLASKRLKERFANENFAHLHSEELSEEDKPVDEPSKIIENHRSSPSAYLIVNSENEKRSSNLFHKLPIDETDHLEMSWRMEAMKQLLKEDLDRELLEDIVLKVGNKSYGCCRLLLVLTSRFFRQQLRLGNLEPFTAPELKIEAADEKTVGAVFDWMHTAEIDLNMTNIGEILHLCDILGIDSLAEKCQGMLEVLREHDGDAVSLYEYATENRMSKVAKEAAEIASDNFLKLVYGEKFLNYTYKQVCMLLCLEDLRVSSEVEVFYAAWRWLTHSWHYRKRYKDLLIHCVNLEKLSEKEVRVLAETLIEGEWGAENPLTWGTDGYMIVGLIRGLLNGNKKRLFGWNKNTEGEPAGIVVQRPIFEWAINKKHPANIRKKKMRKEVAARIIQGAYNDYKERKWWKMINRAALEIQRWFRGFAARKKMEKRVKAAVVIQRAFRKAKDHERRKKLLQLAAPKLRKKKYIKRSPVKIKVK